MTDFIRDLYVEKMPTFSKVLYMTVLLISFSSLAFSDELVVGVGNWAPYYVQRDESGVGLEVLQEVFSLLPQHTVRFKFMGVNRLFKDLKSGALDVATDILNKDTDMHLSNPALRYTNVAITFKKNNSIINGPSDLIEKSIASFQGGKYVCGEEFGKIVETHPDYREYPTVKQAFQVFVRERKEVYVADLYIFLYLLDTLHKGELTVDDFTIHYIFGDVYNSVGFKDPKIRDEFNQALEEIQASGSYDALYDKYRRNLGLQE